LELLGWILLGLVVGMIANLVLARSAASGPVLFILLGIAGAMLAGFLGRSLRLFEAGGLASFVAAGMGAVGLILFYRLLLRSRPRA
jgi:uncharacterized membrane protein YeaQ/YmgE (transglycosylase-associated protein family)